MEVLSKVVEINNLLTIKLEKNSHELDYIEKNILVHPNIPAPPPPWILNGGPLSTLRVEIDLFLHSWCTIIQTRIYIIQ